jgi:hypothetical protein
MLLSKERSVGICICISLLWALNFVSIERKWTRRTTTTTPRQLKGKHLKTLPIIDDNGVLTIQRMPELPPCRFFTDLPHGNSKIEHDREIKAIHYHFNDCAENQLGNRLGEHYMFYMLANAVRLPYRMTCGERSNQTIDIIDPTSFTKGEYESVLRNIAVNLTEPGPVPKDQWGGQDWDAKQVCEHCPRGGWWCQIGLNVMMDVIVPDMRRLAYETDMGKSFEPEDAVIHLRLGDALKGQHDEGIGLLPNGAYLDILEEIEKEEGPLSTIGIVTQPFKKKFVRSFDGASETLSKSRLVAFNLVEQLRAKFPHAIVSVHNGDDDVPLKAYARLVRANKVAICGASTFCTMPVLATNGKGYIFRAEKHSPWAQHVAEFKDNIRTFKVPRLSNNYAGKLNETEILDWLHNQRADAGEFIISAPPLIRNEVVVESETEEKAN